MSLRQVSLPDGRQILNPTEGTPMTLAIFDLDFTLLEGDTEWMWVEYLAEKGVVGEKYLEALSGYFELYQIGALDIRDYQKFFLEPFKWVKPELLQQYMEEYFRRVNRLQRTAMLDRINWHRNQSHNTIMISASTSILVEPIANMLKFQHVICTRAEMVHNMPTGRIMGIPAYQEGKVENLMTWLDSNALSLDDSWAYSDSLNDIPLLEKAEHPVAVTPDPALRKYAMLKGWRIMDL